MENTINVKKANNNKVNTVVVLIMAYMAVVNSLFIAGCWQFLKSHTLWELITSPVQFWGQPVCLTALAISAVANAVWFMYWARK